jgi:putative flippase GtrA
MPPFLRELILYGLLSGLALGVDTGTFLLSLAQGISWPLSAGLGFGLGLMVSYAGSTCFVFHQHRLKDRRAEFVFYAGIGGAGLLLTQLSLWLLLAVLPPLAAKLLSAIGVFGFNFALRKTLLFSRPHA